MATYKIIRTDLTSNISDVIKTNANMKDWYELVENATKRVDFYSSGMPMMTQWNRKFQMTTKSGNRLAYKIISN